MITAVIACLIAPDKLIVFRHKTEQDTIDRKFVKRITAVFAIGTAACVAILMHHSTLIDGILLSLIAILCGVIAIVDTRVRIIPNICSYPMLLIELIYLLMHANLEGLLLHIGTGLSFALMILIAIRIAGHGEVIGTGDLKLLTIVGFLFGTSTSTIIMLVTMIVLMLIDILPGIITRKRSFKDMLPMAPFLVPGILLGLLLTNCSSIHCCFMNYAIDVIYLDSEYKVLHKETVKPWRIGRIVHGAKHVLELPAGSAEQIQVGEVLHRRPV